MTISVVLADANILFSRTLRDYVLYAADEGAIEVHWMRAAHEKAVRYSPKPEAGILATLEVTAGKYAADAIRKVATDSAFPETPSNRDI